MIQRDAHRTGPSARQRRPPRTWLAISVVTAAVLGCNHVPLESGAEDVRVIQASEASGCDRLGATSVKVLAKIVGFKRSEEKMSKELTTLARNAALEKQGNAVAPESEISDGGQKFGIYRCP